MIILITAAGGAFGGMLKQTGIGERIAELTPTANTLLVLPLAFGITTLVRTAQGSATVAMITAVGILAPLAAATDLGYNNVYVALAIGCGSKPIAWMNDSGFWVICKMSGMTEGETLKTPHPDDRLHGPGGPGRHHGHRLALAVELTGDWITTFQVRFRRNRARLRILEKTEHESALVCANQAYGRWCRESFFGARCSVVDGLPRASGPQGRQVVARSVRAGQRSTRDRERPAEPTPAPASRAGPRFASQRAMVTQRSRRVPVPPTWQG